MRTQVFYLVLVVGLATLCSAADPVYRRFVSGGKALTIKNAAAPPYSLVWEDQRVGDNSQQFRIADGFIFAKLFEPAEIVLDVKAFGTTAGTDVIGFPRKNPVSSNQQWILSADATESAFRSGFYLSQQVSGTVTKAVLTYTKAPVQADDVVVDYAFCIDTTGSMGDDIDAVKVNAVGITNALFSAGVDARIAILDYRDFGAERYGYPSDYPYDVKKQFSRSQTEVINGINALELGGGWDWEETGYSCIMAALKGRAGAWRANAEKFIMVITDAPPLDPEPISGFTQASVIAATSDFSLISVTTDRLRATPSSTYPSIKLWTVVVGVDYVMDYWKPLSTATKGDTLYATDAAEIPAMLKTAIKTATANVSVPETSNLQLTLTATSTSLKAGDRLEVTVVVQNAGTVDAATAQIALQWPCFNNMVVGFPSAPFQLQADAVTGLLTITLAKGVKAGSTLTLRVSSDATCGNATSAAVVGIAKDTTANLVSAVVTLSLTISSGLCGAGLSECGPACYNPAQYSCIGGALYASNIRQCGVATYDTNAYDCYDNTLCPKGLLLCGAAHCYSTANYVCINRVKLCPVSAPVNCDDACFNEDTHQCCNNVAANKLCLKGTACNC